MDGRLPLRGRPRRSLLWTVSGLFLLTVLLGTVLQALVVVAVLRPLELRDARARAEIVASAIVSEIAQLQRAPRPAELDSLLTSHREELGGHLPSVVFRSSDGGVVVAPTSRTRFLMRWADPQALAAQTGETAARERTMPRMEVLARRDAFHGSERLGQLQVVRPERPPGELGFLGPHTALLFFPIALLVSVLAGLVIVRLLVRRLHALEGLAARVAEGDLSVRIADHSGDEIGRLAERLDRMTDGLAAARDEVEKTEQQRRQLFTDITHELATPLTSIRGYAETLLNPQVATSSEERSQYLHGVLDEARRLDRLIRDLFELARLEAGAVPLERERLDWAALCRNTVERFQARFRDAGLTLRWNDALPEAWIEADGHRIEQVLENLLGNALRYVPTGSVVEVSLRPSGPRGERLLLSVDDDGPGVPAEQLPLLFQRFYRSHTALGPGAEKAGFGSGLGLAIVHEIAQRHGGNAWARARSPHGLSIVVELPAAPLR